MNRELIYARLLATVEAIKLPPYDLEVAVVSRDFKHWVDAADQPAIYVVQGNQIAKYRRGQPTVWTLQAEIWVYTKKQGDSLGVQVMNPILDALETIFAPATVPAPPNEYTNTLGGLVSHCALAGQIEVSGGYLGDQAVAAIPLEIVTA